MLRSPNNMVRKLQRANPGAEPFATHEITYTYTAAGLPENKTEVITLYGDVTENVAKISYKKI